MRKKILMKQWLIDFVNILRIVLRIRELPCTLTAEKVFDIVCLLFILFRVILLRLY